MYHSNYNGIIRVTRHHTSLYQLYMTQNKGAMIKQSPKSPNFDKKWPNFLEISKFQYQMSQALGYAPTASVYKISYQSGKPSRSYSHLNKKLPKFLRNLG